MPIQETCATCLKQTRHVSNSKDPDVKRQERLPTIATEAYHAYANAFGWERDGKPIPGFGALSEEEQRAWLCAATVAHDFTLKEHGIKSVEAHGGGDSGGGL